MLNYLSGVFVSLQTMFVPFADRTTPVHRSRCTCFTLMSCHAQRPGDLHRSNTLESFLI